MSVSFCLLLGLIFIINDSISRGSVGHELLVLLLVPLKDLFDRPEHPLEGVSLDVDNFGSGLTLDAGLSRSVAD